MILRCCRLFSLMIFAAFLAATMTGCSSDSGGSGGTTPPPTQTPTAISVTAIPDSINIEETTTIKAVVYDSSGKTISGVLVVFTLDQPQIASVNSSATTGADGSATVTMTARKNAGAVKVTATVGTLKSDPPITVTILSSSAPTDMVLAANPDAVLVLGTSSVRAQVLDALGNPVPDGTTVSFKSDNELFGVFTSETATTNSGFASATFTAGDQPGIASVTVRSGNIAKQANITILPAAAASIQFVSASPQRIALQGSGGVETAIVQFVVRDSNGDPVEGATVSLAMTGPNGGEYIDPPPDATPTEIEVSTNATGIAQVTLHSGSVAGPVNVTATTFVPDGTGGQIPISAQSSVISVGGGIASADRFGVAATRLNIAGADFFGVETLISAYLADRFGNYNILQGTTVSFVCEPGLAIDTSEITLGETGIASVTARSQPSGLLNIVPKQWETDLKNYIFQRYSRSINYPRFGRCSVLVYLRGEEHFDDSNANGVYDVGESFGDTEDDPFVDYNDNFVYDGPGSVDPEELYIDSAANGTWDGNNGVWDGDKALFQNIRILLTTSDLIVAWDNSSSNFTVANGGSVSLRLLVCDLNGNPPPPGTKLSVSTDNGVFSSGVTELTYQDSSAIGDSTAAQLTMIEFPYTLSDKDSSDIEAAKRTIVTATVNWDGGSGRQQTYKVSISGTVD